MQSPAPPESILEDGIVEEINMEKLITLADVVTAASEELLFAWTWGRARERGVPLDQIMDEWEKAGRSPAMIIGEVVADLLAKHFGVVPIPVYHQNTETGPPTIGHYYLWPDGSTNTSGPSGIS